MALTDAWLKANLNKVRDKELIKSDRDGLNIRLSPKGKLTYMFRYYYNGMRKEIDLASYPLFSLKEAREEVTRLRKSLGQGYDPKVIRLLERQAIIAAESLTALFDLWYEAYCVHNKKGHWLTMLKS